MLILNLTHIKANDKAKEAGQDAYTLGGKTYKVQ